MCLVKALCAGELLSRFHRGTGLNHVRKAQIRAAAHFVGRSILEAGGIVLVSRGYVGLNNIPLRV